MANKPVLNIIGTRCRPEIEEKFNKWYNEVHIPMLLKFKGLKKVTRYKISKSAPEFPEYLAIYEYPSKEVYEAFSASKELADALAEVKQTWKPGEWDIVWRVQYEAIKSWQK